MAASAVLASPVAIEATAVAAPAASSITAIVVARSALIVTRPAIVASAAIEIRASTAPRITTAAMGAMERWCGFVGVGSVFGVAAIAMIVSVQVVVFGSGGRFAAAVEQGALLHSILPVLPSIATAVSIAAIVPATAPTAPLVFGAVVPAASIAVLPVPVIAMAIVTLRSGRRVAGVFALGVVTLVARVGDLGSQHLFGDRRPLGGVRGVSVRRGIGIVARLAVTAAGIAPTPAAAALARRFGLGRRGLTAPGRFVVAGVGREFEVLALALPRSAAAASSRTGSRGALLTSWRFARRRFPG